MACTMNVDAGDLQEVKGIFETFIEDIHEKDHGVLAYHYYIDEGDRPLIHVIEEYDSAEGLLEHLGNMNGEAVARLLELVELSPLNYYGEPTPEVKEALAGFGKVLYHRPLVSV
jgi:quinol monooxygenase YgiN